MAYCTPSDLRPCDQCYSEDTCNCGQKQAASNRLNHAEFPELLLQDELAVRFDRLVERRARAASFRGQKTLEDFDWTFNRSIRRKAISDLAAGDFVRKHRDAAAR